LDGALESTKFLANQELILFVIFSISPEQSSAESFLEIRGTPRYLIGSLPFFSFENNQEFVV
jgi:hypothetical protein